jgi:hypothetical protein
MDALPGTLDCLGGKYLRMTQYDCLERIPLQPHLYESAIT